MIDLESLTDEQLEILHALQRDNKHMSNEEIFEILTHDVCDETCYIDGDEIAYSPTE